MKIIENQTKIQNPNLHETMLKKEKYIKNMLKMKENKTSVYI